MWPPTRFIKQYPAVLYFSHEWQLLVWWTQNSPTDMHVMLSVKESSPKRWKNGHANILIWAPNAKRLNECFFSLRNVNSSAAPPPPVKQLCLPRWSFHSSRYNTSQKSHSRDVFLCWDWEWCKGYWTFIAADVTGLHQAIYWSGKKVKWDLGKLPCHPSKPVRNSNPFSPRLSAPWKSLGRMAVFWSKARSRSGCCQCQRLGNRIPLPQICHSTLHFPPHTNRCTQDLLWSVHALQAPCLRCWENTQYNRSSHVPWQQNWFTSTQEEAF